MSVTKELAMGILTGLTAAAADEGKKAQVKSAAASGGDEKADQWIALLQGLIDLRTAENPDSQMKGMTGAQLAAGMAAFKEDADYAEAAKTALAAYA